jgi:hypothetical protein
LSLDLINQVFNNIKDNKIVKSFVSELSSYLEKTPNTKEEKTPIVENILANNSLTTGNQNAIIFKENDVILNFANENFKDTTMYFVKDSKKFYWSNNQRQVNNDVYSVLKIENGKIEETTIKKEDMPSTINVNDVFKMENGKYVLDSEASTKLQEKITNMANEIIEKQNTNLSSYQKEGHLYLVSEESKNGLFLVDLTEGTKTEFEEVNISDDLKEKISEGAVLKFTNGKYEYYSNDGYERLQ